VNDVDAANLAVLAIRVILGAMLFAHGWRHLKAVRSGPGMANWFESLGVKPGPLNAWNVTITELAIGPMLVVGFLTPLAYAGLASILLVALMTNHRKNGFFINSPGEGWEYVGVTAGVAIFLATLGPGKWSLDHAFDLHFPFQPGNALLISAAVAIGGTALFLAAFWRPKSVAKPSK
jgi:putative oxidoreductase